MIHDAAEMFVCAMPDAPENVDRKGNRHVADEFYGDNNPQIRQHALEDDFYAGAVHDGAFVAGQVHPCGLMRVDVRGDFRAGVGLSLIHIWW